MEDQIDALMNIERTRQDAKWGMQNHSDGTGGAYNETMAGVAKRECEQAVQMDNVTWKHILKEEVYEAFAETEAAPLKEELIQVMAVCKAWIQCIDRRSNETSSNPS